MYALSRIAGWLFGVLGLSAIAHAGVVVSTSGNTAVADISVGNVDQMIDTIQAHAGIDIANVWNANRLVANDADELLGRAQTLRYTLVRLQDGH